MGEPVFDRLSLTPPVLQLLQLLANKCDPGCLTVVAVPEDIADVIRAATPTWVKDGKCSTRFGPHSAYRNSKYVNVLLLSVKTGVEDIQTLSKLYEQLDVEREAGVYVRGSCVLLFAPYLTPYPQLSGVSRQTSTCEAMARDV